MVFETVSPSPVPSPVGLVVKKGSKIFASLSAGIPGPLSSISAATMRSPARKTSERTSPMFAPTPVSWRAEVRTVMMPPEAGTASAALVRRFVRTWLIFRRSMRRGGRSGARSRRTSICFAARMLRLSLRASSMTEFRSCSVDFERPGGGEIEEVADDVVGPLQRDRNFLEDVLHARFPAEIELGKVINAHGDDGKGILDLMSDAGGEAADGFHLFGLDELQLEGAESLVGLL